MNTPQPGDSRWIDIRQYPRDRRRWSFHCTICGRVGYHWRTYGQALDDLNRHDAEAHPISFARREGV